MCAQHKENLEGLQPAVAIHYVLALAKHLESIDETRYGAWLWLCDCVHTLGRPGLTFGGLPFSA